MNLQQFLLILRSRWRLAAGIFAGVVLCVLGLTFALPKQYMATASVIADNSRADPMGNAARVSEQSAAGYMATQVAIIESDRVAREVAAAVQSDPSLQLEQQWTKTTQGRIDFPSWFVKRLQRVLKVAPTGEGSVIGITVKWPAAQPAAVLANAVAQAYINIIVEMRVKPAKEYASWFDGQSVALRAELETKQQRLNDFLSQNDIVPTDERVDTESARLAELSNQLVAVQTQQIESQTSLQQGLKDTGAASEVLQSPLIAGLEADLARAEARQQNIATTLGTNHPDYQRNEGEIDSLRHRIDSESHRIMASLGGTTRVRQQRQVELSAAIEAQKKRLLDLKRTRDQVSLLEGDVQAARHNLEAVSQRQAQSSLEGSTQQSSVTLLASAITPDEPSSPRLALNGALGVFFGGVLGIGAILLRELGDRRVRSSTELEFMLAGVPVLGRIAAVPIPRRLSAPAGLLESGS